MCDLQSQCFRDWSLMWTPCSMHYVLPLIPGLFLLFVHAASRVRRSPLRFPTKESSPLKVVANYLRAAGGIVQMFGAVACIYRARHSFAVVQGYGSLALLAAWLLGRNHAGSGSASFIEGFTLISVLALVAKFLYMIFLYWSPPLTANCWLYSVPTEVLISDLTTAILLVASIILASLACPPSVNRVSTGRARVENRSQR